MELNATTEWQDAINFSDRHNARYRHECRLKELKRKKLIHRAVDCALVGACAVAIGTMNILNPYIVVIIANVSFGVCCFTCGQICEKAK